MIRYIGIFLICSSAVYGAYYYTSESEKKVGTLGELIKFIEYIKDGIVYLNKPLPDLYREYKSEELLGLCALLCENEWLNALNKSGEANYLDGEAVEVISEFSERLGKTPVGEQEKICELCIMKLKKQLDTMSAETGNKKKTVSSLFVIGGICAVILVI